MEKLYRVKVPRCIDGIYACNSMEDAINYALELRRIICGDGRLYLHEVTVGREESESKLVFSD